MRKVIFLMHVSLDGFVAGSNGEMDWIKYDGEVEQFSHELHDQTDTAIYGRVTYEMMASYWPTVLENPDSTAGDQAHARWLEGATKIVFSRTLESADWDGALLLRDNIKEEMTQIKQQSGKNLWLLGSPTLAQTFMQLGLIDEYRLSINPVILGAGIRLFDNPEHQQKLDLIESRSFNCGVVGLRYQPAQG